MKLARNLSVIVKGIEQAFPAGAEVSAEDVGGQGMYNYLKGEGYERPYHTPVDTLELSDEVSIQQALNGEDGKPKTPVAAPAPQAPAPSADAGNQNPADGASTQTPTPAANTEVKAAETKPTEAKAPAKGFPAAKKS